MQVPYDYGDDNVHLKVIYWGEDDQPHGGPGWYYYDAEYPDEGSCGPFETEADARAHAVGDE